MKEYEDFKRVLLKKLGRNIRAIRIKQGISQKVLAFKTDSARNFIGCIEYA